MSPRFHVHMQAPHSATSTHLKPRNMINKQTPHLMTESHCSTETETRLSSAVPLTTPEHTAPRRLCRCPASSCRKERYLQCTGSDSRTTPSPAAPPAVCTCSVPGGTLRADSPPLPSSLPASPPTARPAPPPSRQYLNTQPSPKLHNAPHSLYQRPPHRPCTDGNTYSMSHHVQFRDIPSHMLPKQLPNTHAYPPREPQLS
jgi:hypothetical protein